MKIREDRIDRDLYDLQNLGIFCNRFSVALTSLVDKSRDLKPLTYEKMY